MRMKIIARNMEVSEALEQQLEKKMKKLEKFFSADVEAQVRLSHEKNLDIVEVTIPLDWVILRGEEKTQDMYASIDLVVDKLIRQVHRHKTRLSKRLKKDVFVPTPEEEPVEENEDEDTAIYKVKRFPVKPQDVEEAILQLQMLDHDFYVFTNAETGMVNVVYRRKDGKFGLLEPDFGE